MNLGKIYSIITRKRGASSRIVRKIEFDQSELRVSIPYTGDNGIGYSEIAIGQKKLE